MAFIISIRAWCPPSRTADWYCWARAWGVPPRQAAAGMAGIRSIRASASSRLITGRMGTFSLSTGA